jgi:hypothetical protein
MFGIDIENKIKSKSVAGIEIILLPAGGFEINAVVLKKKKTSLFPEKKIEGLESIEELAKIISPKLPMVIVLNGKGIIHKKVVISENDTDVSLLNKVLPNAGKGDFCIDQNLVDEVNCFVSVIRSETLNLILKELETYKLKSIAGCLIGPFVINELLSIIKLSSESLEIPGFKLEIKNEKIFAISTELKQGLNDEIKNESQNVIIEGESIPENLLIPFAAALSYYTGSNVGIENSEALNLLKEEYKEKRKFEIIGVGLLVTIFVIVALNGFIFNNYWNKNNAMSSELVLNSSAVNHCDTLKKEFALKKEFLEENGLLENARTSYYADQLGRSIPSSIDLTDVVIHPLKKKDSNSDDESFLFENKKILISGKCEFSTELNNWMKKIKQREWISEVSLLNYIHDKGTNEGIFNIEVKLK